MDSITTARLLLRPLTVQGITPAYVKALNDPEVLRLTEARHVRWTRGRVEAYVRQSNQDGGPWLIGIFLKASGQHIGNVRLFNVSDIHKRAELAFLIFDKSQWSKGYGTEAIQAVTDYAFRVLGLHRIHADYYADNIASAKLFAKAGFRIEGVYHDHFLLAGGYTDSVRVSRLDPRSADASSARPPTDTDGRWHGGPAKPPRPVIPSAGPSITEQDVQLVTEAARDGWYANMSRYIEEFERQFSAYTGLRYALATSSCTAAIHLALLSLRIGRGDEVIVPDITWVASAAPVCYTGARPVLVDIDRRSWCLDPESFERAITRRTKAVIVVGLFGNLPDMDAIRHIAARGHVPIIEDAAESIGAEYKGKRAGTFGRIGVFSFNGTKLLVTGEGGMIVTNDKALHARCARLSHHGIERHHARYYWSHELGYKYKFTNIQAALGLAQLSRIDELVNQRRRLYRWYQERLGGIEGIQLNHEPEHVRSTFWVVTAMISRAYGMRKEQVMSALARRGIGARPFFYPLSSMPTFAPYCRGKTMRKVNPVSYALAPYGVCLPSAASLTEPDVDVVCEAFRSILRRARGGSRVLWECATS